jgi:hypothetical protein
MRHYNMLLRLYLALAAPVGLTGCASYGVEDRAPREEWRRFWFNDAKPQLTPQPVHDGIMP